MADYVTAQAGAALGARLRRLSAAIDADATRVYAAAGHAFEQRWFGVINQLSLCGPMSVSELASALGISHASISETRKSLERAKLIESRPHGTDSRRRTLSLSASGDAMVTRLRPLWNAFDAAALSLDIEAGGVVEALTRLEKALARQSLQYRVAALIAPGGKDAAISESAD